MLELAGRIEIGRLSGGHEHDRIRIAIMDEGSACCAVELRMTLEDFAKAVTSQSVICKLRFNNSGVIGKQHEHKAEDVGPLPFSPSDVEIAAAIVPFEINGWIARRGDAKNHHRRTKAGFNMSFDRYVEGESDV